MYALRYLPWGILIGVPLAFAVLKLVDSAQKRHQKPALQRLPVMLFCIYIAVMLVITFLSRENGSRSGAMDLQLFSTWGINKRNNAFVVENVLLFIPYGFLYRWNFTQTGTIWRCKIRIPQNRRIAFTLNSLFLPISVNCLQISRHMRLHAHSMDNVIIPSSSIPVSQRSQSRDRPLGCRRRPRR